MSFPITKKYTKYVLGLPIPVLTTEEVTFIIAILNKYWFGSFEKNIPSTVVLKLVP
jgi:hypothetical protein